MQVQVFLVRNIKGGVKFCCSTEIDTCSSVSWKYKTWGIALRNLLKPGPVESVKTSTHYRPNEISAYDALKPVSREAYYHIMRLHLLSAMLVGKCFRCILACFSLGRLIFNFLVPFWITSSTPPQFIEEKAKLIMFYTKDLMRLCE